MINMILLPESQNSKTGNILQSYSSPSSCPVSCPFKESGCYAKSIRTSKVWERADNREDKRFISCPVTLIHPQGNDFMKSMLEFSDQDDLANALTECVRIWLA